MSRRGWIRNLIHQVLILSLFAAGLYFLKDTIDSRPELASLVWLKVLFWGAFAAFILLLAQFIQGSFFGYTMERFDPGNVDSLKRLAGMKKFILTTEQSQAARDMENPLAELIYWLTTEGYEEAGRRTMGLVYERPVNSVFSFAGQKYERIFLIYLPMPNVLIVDRLLRESIAYIDHRNEINFAPINHLFIITDMMQPEEVTSAASGVVNFLLRIDEGSLCPWLLDTKYGRLFYPLDRSLIKRSHRRRQNRFRKSFLNWLTRDAQEQDITISADDNNDLDIQPAEVTLRAPKISSAEDIPSKGKVADEALVETTAEVIAEPEAEVFGEPETEVVAEPEAEVVAEPEYPAGGDVIMEERQ